MKVVILAGGFGSRLSEETELKPKPMVEIGGKPILWHIMKIYSSHGINDFIICLGYKGYLIKEYFANYFLHTSDITFDLKNNSMQVHQNSTEPWRVTLVDTGENTMTGGRLKRVKEHLSEKEDFCFTYGDGVGNIDIEKLITLHKQEKRFATITAVQQPGRFGAIKFDSNRVTSFLEKPHNESGWINGGFFVLSPDVFSYIGNDQSIWERAPMQKLAENNQMTVYFHHDFWQPMDTLRERNLLENLWSTNKAPWKTW
jgi:glucose-1-phosphate cytidylyltransferase